MIDNFSAELFQPYLTNVFRIDAGSSILELTLSECQVLKGGREGARAPFSLVFHGPLRPILPQSIYRLEHEQLGEIDLFLVPIGPDERGMQYEAVFT